MKKKNIINLIKYHTEKNEDAFKTEAYEIAKYFDKNDNYQLSEYIMSLLSETNCYAPQIFNDEYEFMQKIQPDNKPLPLPEPIKDNILGIVNAVGHNAGVNKFLFEGPPGTGKTETAKHLSRILERELYIVNFDIVIDSKLGQTSKNISQLFDEISNFPNQEKLIILFDEIDAIAIDRINSNDLREMGRATSSVLKGLDYLNEKIVLIATTNLYNSFDKALIRRFDSVIDFNNYTQNDLLEISEIILSNLLRKFKFAGKNMRLFRKIMLSMDKIPFPGDLTNLIKTSLAFSNPNSQFDYLKRLFLNINNNNKNLSFDELYNLGFSIREIEILTSISKSQVFRKIKEDKTNE